ncbi:MAG: GTP cyclohydrolase 1 type 2 [Bacteroidia bacterium]|nr:GTP cyclohydrolase 1 type 2 [Bacteroidia bacterium]
MQLSEIIKALEAFAPPVYQENYDNAGLITGNPAQDITGALICLDSIEEVIDEAIREKCNLVIAHHPIIFSGLKKINGKNYVERTIIKAIKNDIAIYAAHTNLDNVQQGVNAKIATKIGLKNCSVLEPKTGLLKKLVTYCPSEKAAEVRDALFKAGAGKIGNYDECSYNTEGFGTFRAGQGTNPFVGQQNIQHQETETRIETIFPAPLQSVLLRTLFTSHPYEEVAYDIYPLENEYKQVGSGLIGDLENPQDELNFLKGLKNSLKTDCIRYTDLTGNKIKRVAVCGGAGSFLLKNAINAGADAFVTADLKYHQFFDAEGKILIADVGHFESEQFTGEIFYDLLMEKFPTFAVRLSKTNTNPVNYL